MRTLFIALLAPLMIALPVIGQEHAEMPTLDETLDMIAEELAEMQTDLGTLAAADWSPSRFLVVAPDSTALLSQPNAEASRVATVPSHALLEGLLELDGWYLVRERDSEAPERSLGWLKATPEIVAVTPDDSETAVWNAALPPDSELMIANTAMMAGMPGDRWLKYFREKVLTKAQRLREALKNNPYVSLSGFDVEVSFPPGFTVAFEWK